MAVPCHQAVAGPVDLSASHHHAGCVRVSGGEQAEQLFCQKMGLHRNQTVLSSPSILMTSSKGLRANALGCPLLLIMGELEVGFYIFYLYVVLSGCEMLPKAHFPCDYFT